MLLFHRYHTVQRKEARHLAQKEGFVLVVPQGNVLATRYLAVYKGKREMMASRANRGNVSASDLGWRPEMTC